MVSFFHRASTDWRSWLLDQKPARYAIMDNTSGGSSSRASLDDDTEGLMEKRAPRHDPWWKRTEVLAAGHLVLFAVYAGSLYAAIRGRADWRTKELPVSPAVSAIEWEQHKFTLEDRIQEKGSFSGRPSADLDKAWHDLLNYENIVIEPHIMEHYGRRDIGVAVPEGGGYLGTLNVYHELHCLKRLHQYMYPEYYFGNLTAHQRELNRLHN
ncbi:hypothetical protein E4U53_005272, partial [Claviceps sorghi]